MIVAPTTATTKERRRRPTDCRPKWEGAVSEPDANVQPLTAGVPPLEVPVLLPFCEAWYWLGIPIERHRTGIRLRSPRIWPRCRAKSLMRLLVATYPGTIVRGTLPPNTSYRIQVSPTPRPWCRLRLAFYFSRLLRQAENT